MKEEKILNIPNTLTALRVVLAFFIVYLIFTEVEIIPIVIIFVFAAFTDFLDGQAARRFKQETEFGRKFDIRADRILWGSTALAFLIAFSIRGLLSQIVILQLFLIMSRELISLPFSFAGARAKKEIPEARKIGKVTTLLQGFALPILMLSIFYSFFEFAIYLSILTGIVGAISASYFIRDIRR
jgi:cardiolipin synthase